MTAELRQLVQKVMALETIVPAHASESELFRANSAYVALDDVLSALSAPPGSLGGAGSSLRTETPSVEDAAEPVNCCGCYPEIEEGNELSGDDDIAISCAICGRQTGWFATQAHAVTEWNSYFPATPPSPQRAMAGARTADHAEEPGLLTRALEIGERLRTQDNRITNLPMFAVQQRVRIYGLDPEYADHVVWLDCCNDYGEASPEEHAKFEALHDDGEDVADWQRIGYRDTWEFVTCCLTEQGCKDYLKVNGHNLKEPRIYAYSGFRNAEWEFLRNYFLAAASPATQREEDHSIQPFDKRCADALADEVAVLVRRGVIDMRSPAADALLDYRDPPSSPRADRLAQLEAAAARPPHNDGQEDAVLVPREIADGAADMLRSFQSTFGSHRPDRDEEDERTAWDEIDRLCDGLAARQQPLAATDEVLCGECNNSFNTVVGDRKAVQCPNCSKTIYLLTRAPEEPVAAPKVATDTTTSELLTASELGVGVATDTSGTEAAPVAWMVLGVAWGAKVSAVFKDKERAELQAHDLHDPQVIPLFTRSAHDGEPGKSATSPHTDEPR